MAECFGQPLGDPVQLNLGNFRGDETFPVSNKCLRIDATWSAEYTVLKCVFVFLLTVLIASKSKVAKEIIHFLSNGEEAEESGRCGLHIN